MNKKYKTFEITDYYRGIELKLLCVTTSRKRFAEITDKSESSIKSYGYCYDLRYDICNQNPDKLFAKPGMGGEGLYIFKRDDIKTYEEYIKLIDEHRLSYKTYNEFMKKLNNE
jgi:hypothetical protein